MGTPYLGEIRFTSFNFAPRGWALCNGQQLPVQQNQALFALIGKTYGGDGQTTFNLPDLRGRIPTHVGQGLALASNGGEARHVLSILEMPGHGHSLNADASNPADNNSNIPSGTTAIGASVAHAATGDTPINIYNSTLASPTAVASAMVGSNGSGQPHENRQPFQVVSAMIAMQGVYPPRS